MMNWVAHGALVHTDDYKQFRSSWKRAARGDAGELVIRLDRNFPCQHPLGMEKTQVGPVFRPLAPSRNGKWKNTESRSPEGTTVGEALLKQNSLVAANAFRRIAFLSAQHLTEMSCFPSADLLCLLEIPRGKFWCGMIQRPNLSTVQNLEDPQATAAEHNTDLQSHSPAPRNMNSRMQTPYISRMRSTNLTHPDCQGAPRPRHPLSPPQQQQH
ncbi:uncharacterized protein LOC144754987 isoform X2 [Lissotriton helveticus]